MRGRGQSIALGTGTDHYQPAKKQFEITRRLLELFAEFRGLEFSITTKGTLILRDLDLLRRNGGPRALRYLGSSYSPSQSQLELPSAAAEASLQVPFALTPLSLPVAPTLVHFVSPL